MEGRREGGKEEREDGSVRRGHRGKKRNGTLEG